jgi:Alpha-mannosidase
MIKGHFIQHTHWDREWYFTTADSVVLSEQVFTEILDELEANPLANFCLDGQSSIVDEYLEIHPEKLATIKELVKKQRLFVGPWYTQTDALLVDDESMLRNLMVGIYDIKTKYGEPMMLGYLPDTFGFNAQLPTMLKQVGIDNILFWRGIKYDKLVASPYFKWQGLGATNVLAINFPFGYGTGLLSIEAEENLSDFIDKRLDYYIDFIKDYGNHEDIIVPSGADQKNILPNFEKVLEKINQKSKYEHIISDYPTFVDEIRKKDGLPLYQGELREPTYARVHRTIGSVRMGIKLANYHLEQKMLRRIEPLVVIARKNGINIGNGLIRKIWKKLFECQAHDSIGGCVSDNVAVDIIHRQKEALEMIDGIENLITKRFADALNLSENEILVFNTELTKFSGDKTIHIVAPNKNISFSNDENATIINEIYYPERKDIMKLVAEGYEFFDEPEYYELTINLHVEIPACGYCVIAYEESETPLNELKVHEGNCIKNNRYKITFEDGLINLDYNGKKISNFISIVDEGNAGDTYDYSPLSGDKEIIFNFNESFTIKSIKENKLVILGEMELPYDLEDRLSQSPQTKLETIRLELTLKEDTSTIEGKIVVDNQILSHRLRLKLQVEDKSESSIAQIQNGFVKNTPDEIPIDWQKTMVEKPVNIEICDKSITVEAKEQTYTIFTDGIKEYERVGAELFITLMATTGQLGKPNLEWRPGRASGDTTNEGHIMMPTPLAQELGENVFTFGIHIENEQFNEHKIAKLTTKRLHQSMSYQKQTLNVFIKRLDNKIWPAKNYPKVAKAFSAVELSTKAIVSAIYPAYFHENAYVIRVKNPTGAIIGFDELELPKGIIVNALEEQVELGELPAYDYVNILVEF